jgi:D-glycerate 3-kinase
MASPAHPAAPAAFAAEFVDSVLADAQAAKARVYGISGLQGSGKSTLAAQLVAAAGRGGLRAIALSIDDFYLDAPARQALAREVHPLLATRGPPGTHELPLACWTVDALRDGQPARVPAFDKLADRRVPAAQWRAVGQVDLVVFEGWFLGTPAQAADALSPPINDLERDEDADGVWRRHCNDALARDYPALWRRIDRLLFLQPPGFDVVREWRWQQECAMAARVRSRQAMTREALARFVQHYERASRHALRTLPAIADAVVELDHGRGPGALSHR